MGIIGAVVGLGVAWIGAANVFFNREIRQGEQEREPDPRTIRVINEMFIEFLNFLEQHLGQDEIPEALEIEREVGKPGSNTVSEKMF